MNTYDFECSSLSEKENVVNTLREYGICKISNYLSGEILNNLTLEVKEALKGEGDDSYAFGKALKFFRPPLPVMSDVFSSSEMSAVAYDYMGEHYLNYDIFITHDWKHDNGLARNGYLHFDRRFTFKFLVYLSDVDENCGPFSIVPRSHLKGKELREKMGGDEYEDKKNRIFLDYPELGYTEEDIVPILGKAGDLIVFETDIFHLGGLVEEGRERLLIRGHSRAEV